MKINSVAKRRKLFFGSVGTFPLEVVERVDCLTLDSRANLIAALPEAAGGMPKFAAQGVRYFDRTANVAIGGLIGGLDPNDALEAVRELECCTDYLYPVPGKRTNRSRVICDDHNRFIERLVRQISFEQDLQDEQRHGFAAFVSRSHSCLLGNLPTSLTQELIQCGRDADTYMALGPGGQQLSQIGDFQPQAMFLNFGEAKQATRLDSDQPECVFAALLDRCRADHAVVMTGSGQHPTFVADVLTGQQTRIEPVSVTTIPDRCQWANCLGTGDVMAGTVTFLLGLAATRPVGEDLFDIVRFGQDVCLLHLTQSESMRDKVQAGYRRLRARLTSREPEREAFSQPTWLRPATPQLVESGV